MSRSIRILYRGQKGTIRKNWNWDAINLDTAVLVTAAEFAPDEGMQFPGVFKTQGRPLLGAANVYATNIGPHGNGAEAGGVEFLLHVDWESPLNVVVTITALDQIEVFEKP
ncbi:hypothetical protein OG241_21205 [Streptomyces sp. NBC_01390]|uniref:hypothetical protein n=1 Tax=Streptomyces sp. NBC_01390 TaxID=2903850 RepID=UPI00324F577B